MNTELYIAKRILFTKNKKGKISTPIVRLTIFAIALSVATMILSIAVVIGFKSAIRNKIIGFGGHIQITNFDSNKSYEQTPISLNQTFYPKFPNVEGVRHIQVFANKMGLIKAKNQNEAVIIKGIGADFDWSFFSKNLINGNLFRVTNDSTPSNHIIISKYIAQRLNLDINDPVVVLFVVNNKGRVRKFSVSGIYETGLEEFDKLYAIVDIKHIQKLNGWSSKQVGGFEILITDFNKLPYITDKVFELAGTQIFEDGSKLKVENIYEKNPQIFDWLELTNMNVFIILFLMTAVACVNMASGLLVLILERTSFIGLLKALGAYNWSIRKIFLYNGFYILLKGLFWGNLLGIAICLIQQQFGIIKLNPASYYVNTVPVYLDVYYILLLNLSAIVITVFMLLIPSIVISKISPIKAINLGNFN